MFYSYQKGSPISGRTQVQSLLSGQLVKIWRIACSEDIFFKKHIFKKIDKNIHLH